MGLYIQDDYWDALSGMPKKTQDEVFGALIRLYFKGEEDAGLKGVSEALFKAFKGRVILAKKKSEAGSTKHQNDIKPESKRESEPHQNDIETDVPLAKSEREREIVKEPSPNGDVKKTKRFVPPTHDEVASYAAERGRPDFNAERFCDYYASNGWKVGRNPMKDWKATVRTWLSKDEPRKEARDAEAFDGYASVFD